MISKILKFFGLCTIKEKNYAVREEINRRNLLEASKSQSELALNAKITAITSELEACKEKLASYNNSIENFNNYDKTSNDFKPHRRRRRRNTSTNKNNNKSNSGNNIKVLHD